MAKSNYHHGDLADALVEATVSLLQTKNVAELSLREVARVAGVSHSAPAHHFKDKLGLLTAVAAEGHKLLTKTLIEKTTACEQVAQSRYVASGEAYIRFAIAQPAHFEIMFRPELINVNDVSYQRHSNEARDILATCVRDVLNDDSKELQWAEFMVISSWSQVHGFAVLWLSGNFGDQKDELLFERLLNGLLYKTGLAYGVEHSDD